jgi:hypothetical protein
MCEVIPSLLDLILAFFVLHIKNDLLELMKWNHFDWLNVKEIMNQWRLDVVHFNGRAMKENC